MDTKFFDSLLEGDSPNGVKLGMGLTNGDFWPRVNGCSNLYRGTNEYNIDLTQLLKVDDADSVQISVPSYIPHEPSSTYFYLLRRASHFGKEDDNWIAMTKISFDTNGDIITQGPNDIFHAKAEQTQDLKAKLTWFYCPIEQSSAPTTFKIYSDNATGEIDFNTEIATVNYEGIKYYQHTTSALSEGKYLFAIKAADSDGLTSQSYQQLSIDIVDKQQANKSILSSETL